MTMSCVQFQFQIFYKKSENAFEASKYAKQIQQFYLLLWEVDYTVRCKSQIFDGQLWIPKVQRLPITLKVFSLTRKIIAKMKRTIRYRIFQIRI